jgi:hypothetical protein
MVIHRLFRQTLFTFERRQMQIFSGMEHLTYLNGHLTCAFCLASLILFMTDYFFFKLRGLKKAMPQNSGLAYSYRGVFAGEKKLIVVFILSRGQT